MSTTHEPQIDTESDVWEYSNIRVNDDGHVVGSAYTRPFGHDRYDGDWPFDDGYDVQISVSSYDYERNDKTRTNHVPNVVVTDPSGAIVAEPHARDSRNPHKAIRNARRCAEYVVEDPDQFDI